MSYYFIIALPSTGSSSNIAIATYQAFRPGSSFMGNKQLHFTTSQKHFLKFLDRNSSFSASSRINNV